MPARYLLYLKINALRNYLYIFFFAFLLCTVDDTSDGAFVQRRGRFKVTSADLSPMVCIKWQIFLPITFIHDEYFFVEISKAVFMALHYWVKVMWNPLNHVGGNVLFILTCGTNMKSTLYWRVCGRSVYCHFFVYGESSNSTIIYELQILLISGLIC